jgi:hypothetical protein
VFASQGAQRHEGERRLAHPRLSIQKRGRTGDESAAQYTVEFADAGRREWRSRRPRRRAARSRSLGS